MGVTPGWGGGQRLSRLIGPGKAAYFYGLGISVSAAEALRHGIVDFVEADIDNRIDELGQIAATVPPQALRLTKRAIREGKSLELSEAYSVERSLFAESWVSDEHNRAVERFLVGKSNNFRKYGMRSGALRLPYIRSSLTLRLCLPLAF